MSLPTQEYLKSRIEYNPETHLMTWKLVDESYGSRWRHFNTAIAGTPLGEAVRINKSRFSRSSILARLLYNRDSSKEPDYHVINPNVGDYLSYNHVTGDLVWIAKPNPRATNLLGRVAGNRNIYIDVTVQGVRYKGHRLAWFLYYGVDPGKYQIDHIDENKYNNSILNLRLANNSFNTQVRNKQARGYVKKDGSYFCHIEVNNRREYLGVFTTEQEAKQAYETALKNYKPVYSFTDEEQAVLDELYNYYPNCAAALQQRCHDIHVKAIQTYIDAASVHTPN
jgi:hypothetical protein